IRIIRATASGWPLVAASKTWTTCATNSIANVQGEAVFAVDRKRLAVSIKNRFLRIDNGCREQCSHNFHITMGDYGNARRQPGVDRELRCVLRGDEQPALFDKMAQVIAANITKAGAHVIS